MPSTDFQYTEEVLNTLDPSGIPPHLLQLKKNAIIMTLRNIDPMYGVVNGTRLRVLNFTTTCIEALILTGPGKNEKYIIPRFYLYADKTSPIPFKRKQFPVKVSFAMTINKAQGQTLDHMSLYLPEPVFSHGQLYVALGRVRSPNNLSVYIIPGKAQGTFENFEGIYTRNVVFKEVFTKPWDDEDDNEIEDYSIPNSFEFTLENDKYDFFDDIMPIKTNKNKSTISIQSDFNNLNINSKQHEINNNIINDSFNITNDNTVRLENGIINSMIYNVNETMNEILQEKMNYEKIQINNKNNSKIIQRSDKEEMDFDSDEDFDII